MFAWFRKLLKQVELTQSPDDITLEKVFTNANEVREAFEDIINNADSNKRLLVIHGVGAVGKSTALRMGRLSCRRKDISAVLVDAKNVSSVIEPTELNILKLWAEALKADSIKMSAFDSIRERHFRLKGIVQTQSKQDTQVSTIVSEATKLIPGIGSVLSPVVGPAAEIFKAWLHNKFSREDVELFLEPTKQITTSFLKDLSSAVSIGRRIILMLDTYEKVTALNGWLCNLTLRLPRNVPLVIAGRELPDWERDWTGYWIDTHFIGMKEMTSADIRELIIKSYSIATHGKVADPQLVEPIVEFARGLPIVATSAVRLWIRYGIKDFQQLKPRVVSNLVDRLMEDVPEDMKKAFKAASILRYFNVDSLKVLIPDSNAEELYEELIQWPFVRSQESTNGMAVHETMREMINEEIYNRSPSAFHQLHETAASYYESQLNNATPSEAERYNLERLYHRVSANEEEGTKLFQKIAEELTNSLLYTSLRGLLVDANSYDFQLENSRLWKKLYEARLEEAEQDLKNAEKTYREIAENRSAEPKLQAYALFDRGKLYSGIPERLRQPDGVKKATSLLEKSLRILPEPDPRLIQAHSQLYYIAVSKCRFEQGIKHLEKQLAFYERLDDKGGILSTLSYFKDAYSVMGDWNNVFKVANRADGIFQSLPESPVLRNLLEYCPWVYIWVGRYAEAEIIIRRSLEFYSSINEIHTRLVFEKDLCLSLAMQGKYNPALQQFSQLRKKHKELNDKYPKEIAGLLGYWGFILTNQGNLEQAEKYLKQSLEMKQNLEDELGIPEIYNWLGELYEMKANCSEGETRTVALMNAESCYQQSLERRWAIRHYFECGALVGLARVSYFRGDFLAVQEYVADAEQLAQQYEYNDYAALLRLLRGHSAWLSQINSSSPDRSNEEKFDIALRSYQESLIYGLRYNRFLLDEILTGQSQRAITLLKPIILTCLEHGEEGQRMLTALRSWWQVESNNLDIQQSETISLTSLGESLLLEELSARQREPGDGAPQRTLIEQIDAALLT